MGRAIGAVIELLLRRTLEGSEHWSTVDSRLSTEESIVQERDARKASCMFISPEHKFLS